MNRKCLRAVALLAASIGASVAQAGTASITADGNTATFEYNDSMLRINNSVDTDSYVIFREGNLYAVSMAGGQPMVIDAGAMMEGMGTMNMGAANMAGDIDGRLLSLEDTGDNETIAGITGDVYKVRFEDQDGVEREETMVLSSDPRVREFNSAMFRMVDLAAQYAPANARQQRDEFRKRLDALGLGVLRFGDDMAISSITDDTVAIDRFALPAQPMDLQGLGAMMGALKEQMEKQP